MNDIFTFLIISAGVLLVIGFISLYYSSKSRVDTLWKKQLRKELAKSSKDIKSSNPRLLRHLVIDTDKHLDYALKNSKVKGQTLGERLKYSRKLFDKSTYNLVWEAHKLRNKLVHEMSFEPDAKELKRAYYDLRKGINSLM